MAQVHDPTYEVRRVLWLAYGVLAVGLILFAVAIILIRQGPTNFIAGRPPTGLVPNSSPSATPSPSVEASPSPSATPAGQAQGGAPATQPAGASGQLPASGYPRGEPPGDIEDDTFINPAYAPIPQLPVPVPTVPSLVR